MDTLRFRLDQDSLVPFRAAWNRAVQSQLGRNPAALLDAAQVRVGELEQRAMPGFVRERLALVPLLLAMLRDPGWDADSGVQAGFAGALAYLDEPDDLIPDSHPRYGLLDDALVLEIALAAHRDEWLAWQEFQAFRRRHCPGEPLQREEWLAMRRYLQRDGARGNGVLPGQRRHSYLDTRGAPREAFKVH
jgi:uncharacterized membrane protein YkvA (DUF1232 family)